MSATVESPIEPMLESTIGSTVRITKAYAQTRWGQVHYRYLAGAGTPAIFLHQTASSGAMWTNVMCALAASRPLYAFDTPGFGGSFDPEGVASIGDFATWLEEALDAAGLEAGHLVGHHTGACIALELAAREPRRFVSLALSGPLPLTPEERRSFATKFGAPFMPKLSAAHLLDAWQYLREGGAGARVELLDRELADTLRALPTRSKTYDAVWSFDFAARLREYPGRLLLLSAPDDVLHPFFERARQIRPDAEARLLSGGASFAPDLAPAEYAAHLRRHFGSA